jgi:predicted RNA binding protein YcfA (HicA-like mRNA interferase family)
LTAKHSKPIERSLKAFGFVEELSHHRQFRYFTVDGTPTKAKTFISHGSKDYGDKLLSSMARQLYLTKKELLRLIDGEMTREEYEAILRIKGII